MSDAAVLEGLGRRIERVAVEPERVDAGWSVRLVGPLLRTFGWRARFRTTALRALLDALEAMPPPRATAPEGMAAAWRDERARRTLSETIDAAIDELDDNVVQAERSCVVSGGVPVAHAAWLRRLYEVVTRAARAGWRAVERGPNRQTRRLVRSIDPVAALPPLALSHDEAAATTPAAPAEPKGGRLLELELAAIDHLLDAAREETAFLGHRRRLLEAARRLLLEASAALPLDRAGVDARSAHVTAEIVRLDRLQGAGLSADVSLLHQARSALTGADRQRLHAALVALDGAALSAGDTSIADRTGEALDALWAGADPFDARTVQASTTRSQRELLGADVVGAVETAYERARDRLGRRPKDADDAAIYDLAQMYLAPGAHERTLPLVLASDGCFEVGGALSPVRVTEHELVARAVTFPTPDLVLLPARDPSDVPGSVVEDPRMLLLSLAQGRLLTRRYVQVERVERTRTKLVGEVRVYLLDGSGSMVEEGTGGARARMRDAILLAELASLMRRYQVGDPTLRVVLYYRYFSHALGDIVRVDSSRSALAAMGDVVGRMRVGGTDIDAALLGSFAQIREAREADPDLARAQIVLVTDGEAAIDEAKVEAARAGLETLPIQLSVVALGHENPALRALVARQRARGEGAFYHFVDDATLAAMSERGVDRGPAIHLPPVADAADDPTALRAQLGDLLDDLGALERTRHLEAIEAAALDAKALTPDERTALDAHGEGRKAHREAAERDRRALERRFDRWFPAPTDRKPAERDGGEPPPERDDVEAVLVALATIAEVVGAVGGTDLARRADAIDLIERLLPDARLSPARYAAAIQAPEVEAALASVRRQAT